MMFIFAQAATAGEFKPNYEAQIDSKAKAISFNFKSGQVQVRYEDTREASNVKCELSPTEKSPEKARSEFDFGDSFDQFRCEILLTRDIKVNINGHSGQVQAENLVAETNISLTNGQIQFTGNSQKNYEFDVSVENGMKPMLPMNSAKKAGKAIKIKLRTKNGMVGVQ